MFGSRSLQEKERWEEADPRDIELNRVLMEHLVSKSATAINAALPTLLVSIILTYTSLPSLYLCLTNCLLIHDYK